jgi:molybdate transport repressor ModE-like protein
MRNNEIELLLIFKLLIDAMDIDLARTFLEIIRCGSFIAAAERLHITQTSVTARIQNLEDQLGCRLFVRNRGGARLTSDGERFTGYARQLVQTWEAARRDLPLPDGLCDILSIGAEISLWNPLLLNWLNHLHVQQPELAVRAEVSVSQALHEKLKHGLLDAALVHQPDYRHGIQVEQLLEEKLILVRSTTKPGPYIYVDWGEFFRQQHDAALPQYTHAKITLDLGPLALYYLLENGGSGYFRNRVVQRYLNSGEFERVVESPEFSCPIYLVYPRNNAKAPLQKALDSLRVIARSGSDWSQ